MLTYKRTDQFPTIRSTLPSLLNLVRVCRHYLVVSQRKIDGGGIFLHELESHLHDGLEYRQANKSLH